LLLRHFEIFSLGHSFLRLPLADLAEIMHSGFPNDYLITIGTIFENSKK